MTTVKVSRKGANRVESGHPWIYSSDVLDRANAQAGDVVDVDQLLGGGEAQPSTLERHVDDRGRVERQELRQQQPADDGDAEGDAQLRSRAVADHEG